MQRLLGLKIEGLTQRIDGDTVEFRDRKGRVLYTAKHGDSVTTVALEATQALARALTEDARVSSLYARLGDALTEYGDGQYTDDAQQLQQGCGLTRDLLRLDGLPAELARLHCELRGQKARQLLKVVKAHAEEAQSAKVQAERKEATNRAEDDIESAASGASMEGLRMLLAIVATDSDSIEEKQDQIEMKARQKMAWRSLRRVLVDAETLLELSHTPYLEAEEILGDVAGVYDEEPVQVMRAKLFSAITRAAVVRKDANDPEARLDMFQRRLSSSDLRSPKKTTALSAFINHHKLYSGKLRFNQLAMSPYLDGVSWTPTHTHDMRVLFEAYCGTAPANEYTEVIVAMESKANTYHPIREYLAALEWDGVRRIDDWLSTYLKVDDTPYTRAIGAKFLIGAAARAARGGITKVDTVLVLKGAQGALKSSALAALFGEDNHVDTVQKIDEKDGLMALHSCWCFEAAEMACFEGKKQNTIKSFLSSRVDSFRPPYGHKIEKHARHSVIVATTNDGLFLNDGTGSRRWWVVGMTRRANIAKIKRDRDQLWAEAYHRLLAGSGLSEEPADFLWWLTKAEDEARESSADEFQIDTSDPFADRVMTWISTDARALTLRQGGTVLKLSAAQIVANVGLSRDRNAGAGIARTMRALGCEREKFKSHARPTLWIIDDRLIQDAEEYIKQRDGDPFKLL